MFSLTLHIKIIDRPTHSTGIYHLVVFSTPSDPLWIQLVRISIVPYLDWLVTSSREKVKWLWLKIVWYFRSHPVLVAGSSYRLKLFIPECWFLITFHNISDWIQAHFLMTSKQLREKSKYSPLDTIHSTLKFRPGSVHVCNHSTNITDDCGKYQHTSQEIDGNEDVLRVVNRFRSLTNCG